MERPTRNTLLPPPVRPWAVAVLAACLVTMALLAGRYGGETQAGWLDSVVGVRFHTLLGGHARFLQLIWLGDPVAVAVIGGLLCLTCIRRRRFRAALLVALAVPAAGVTTELVLKPLIHRTYFGGLALPSGHATGVFTIAALICVLLVNPARPGWSAALRAAVAVGALSVASAVCAAVLGARNHYPTDVLGGAAVATGVVILTALLLDLLPDRFFTG